MVDDFGDKKYEVVINGKPQLIYEGDGGDDSWPLALKRLLEITNGLLEEAGSGERLYFSYSGNDGRVVLLTPEMQDYIESIGDVMDYKWMPRRAEQIKVSGPRRQSPDPRRRTASVRHPSRYPAPSRCR